MCKELVSAILNIYGLLVLGSSLGPHFDLIIQFSSAEDNISKTNSVGVWF